MWSHHKDAHNTGELKMKTLYAVIAFIALAIAAYLIGRAVAPIIYELILPEDYNPITWVG